MTDKLNNQMEIPAAGCARLHEVAFTLTAKQQIAVAALCSGAGVDAAAAAAGVNPSTLWRWRELPEFREAERAANARVFDQAAGELQALGAAAVAALRDLLQHDNPGIRLRAGCAALALAFKGHQAIDIETRLANIETKLSNFHANAQDPVTVPRSVPEQLGAMTIIPHAHLERARKTCEAEARASCAEYISDNAVRNALLADAQQQWDAIAFPDPSTPTTRAEAFNLGFRFRQAVVNAAIRNIPDDTARRTLCEDIDHRLLTMHPFTATTLNGP
jgi:hypothetical protein